VQAYPSFAEIDEAPHAAWGGFGKAGAIDDAAFAYPIRDFYRTDMISRASPTMANCAAARAEAAAQKQKTGTHG